MWISELCKADPSYHSQRPKVEASDTSGPLIQAASRDILPGRACTAYANSPQLRVHRGDRPEGRTDNVLGQVWSSCDAAAWRTAPPESTGYLGPRYGQERDGRGLLALVDNNESPARCLPKHANASFTNKMTVALITIAPCHRYGWV